MLAGKIIEATINVRDEIRKGLKKRRSEFSKWVDVLNSLKKEYRLFSR